MSHTLSALERMQRDPVYRDSPKHNHNQKIARMVMKGMIRVDARVNVRHQSSCGIMLSSLLYCDCDPIITEKLWNAKGRLT